MYIHIFMYIYIYIFFNIFYNLKLEKQKNVSDVMKISNQILLSIFYSRELLRDI